MTHWLAAHIHYAEPWDAFLREALTPFARKACDERGALGFFFIRYWERGPHIRLRFRGETDVLERLRPNIEAYFHGYFDAHPSTLAIPDWAHSAPPERAWRDNNHVFFVDYEPEIERYGGPVAIQIAERQFQASSEAVLRALHETPDWNYERALGFAIQMHLAFVHACGFTLDAARVFFRRIARAWLPRAYIYDLGADREEHERLQKEVKQAFDAAYAHQKASIDPFCATLWHGLQTGAEFDNTWLNTWLDDMRGIHEALGAAHPQIEYPQNFMADSDPDLGDFAPEIFPILESYIHMTNNRLGILNRDEAFLGYLLDQAISHMGDDA